MVDSDTEPIERQPGEPVVPVPPAERGPAFEPDAEPVVAESVVREDLDSELSAFDPDAEPVADGDGPVGDDLGRPYRVGAWVAVVGVLALAGFFVAVPAHTYDLDFRNRVIPDTRRIDLIELWRVQTRNLPDVRYEALFQAAYVACAIAFLLGSAALVWLALVEIRPSTPSAIPQTRTANASTEPTPAD